MKRLLLLAAAIIMLAVQTINAQPGMDCRGVVIDDQNEPVIGATVAVPGTSVGVATDLEGKFMIKVPAKAKELRISAIGYKPVTLKVAPNVGTITLETEATMLQDVVITSSVAKTRKTPVAMSQVDAATIDVKLGNQELPEVLKTTPGVWATRDGGAFGDSKINIRGFKASNTATMVNGVPVNDMEWGGIYWSNWSGLGDVTSSMQVQRGLGATMISAPSFGGTINIITRGLDSKKGGTAWYGLGNDNTMNYGLSFSTGLMKNGWAMTFLGSRRTGDGYVQGTEYKAWNYFLNITKRINESHQIGLTVTGAPQTHYKRSSSDGLSVQGWQDAANYMAKGEAYRYNPTFGYGLNGERKSSQVNTYNKPVAMLNHTWVIDEKSSLSSAIYASVGTGYGTSGQGARIGTSKSTYYSYWYGASNGNLNWKTIENNGVTYSLRKGDGTFAYDQIQLMNQNSTTGSVMVMSNSVNNHQWYGGVSNYKNELTKEMTLMAGIDLRYYYGKHTNEISDLYNGEYFIDAYRDASFTSSMQRTFATEAEREAYVNQKLGVGDVVYRNWDSRILQEGVFAQLEYNLLDNNLNLVVSGAVNNNTYTRYEHMYVNKEDEKSPTKNFIAGSAKAGANYNIDAHNNVFVNGGYITRAPYLQYGVFVSPANSNALNPNPKNEKVTSAELGYEYHSSVFTAKVNGYFTLWKDRTLMSSGELDNGDRYTVNMNGVDSRYMGVELDFVYKPVRWFELSGMFSWADNTWRNAPIGYYYNSNGQALSSLSGNGTTTTPYAEDHLWAQIDQKGIKVGGSAQTTGALGVSFKPFSGFRIGGDWTMNMRNYSDFSMNNSSSLSALSPGKTLTINKPWEIPWGQQLDLHASYSFPICKDIRGTFSANVNNVFNNNYIMDAYTDYSSVGTWENAYRIFYSLGRTFSLRFKVHF